jgi:hypothetical protein
MEIEYDDLIITYKSPVLFVLETARMYLEKQIWTYKPEKYTPTLLSIDISPKEKEIYQRFKMMQQTEGKIWQKVMGNYPPFIDLGEGDESGLDIISHERKIVIELKNKYNTDNHSSKKFNIQKLKSFKKKHPDYTAVYGIVNDTNLGGKIDEKDDYVIYTGDKLLGLIFGLDKEPIVNGMKELFSEYF